MPLNLLCPINDHELYTHQVSCIFIGDGFNFDAGDSQYY